MVYIIAVSLYCINTTLVCQVLRKISVSSPVVNTVYDNKTLSQLYSEFGLSVGYQMRHICESNVRSKKYHFPSIEIIGTYFRTSKVKVNGDIYSISVHQEYYPFDHKGYRIRPELKFGFGVSYSTKTYDKIDNPNALVSSHINFYFLGSFGFSFLYFKDIHPFIHLQYVHVSNGQIQRPNYGMNNISLVIGVNVIVNREEIKKASVSKQPKEELKERDRKSLPEKLVLYTGIETFFRHTYQKINDNVNNDYNLSSSLYVGVQKSLKDILFYGGSVILFHETTLSRDFLSTQMLIPAISAHIGVKLYGNYRISFHQGVFLRPNLDLLVKGSPQSSQIFYNNVQFSFPINRTLELRGGPYFILFSSPIDLWKLSIGLVYNFLHK